MIAEIKRVGWKVLSKLIYFRNKKGNRGDCNKRAGREKSGKENKFGFGITEERLEKKIKI